jgi:hypothetical protein
MSDDDDEEEYECDYDDEQDEENTPTRKKRLTTVKSKWKTIITTPYQCHRGNSGFQRGHHYGQSNLKERNLGNGPSKL